MKDTAFARWLMPILVLSLMCSFTFTTIAQTYYPPAIGNVWVLTSTDGFELRSYSLEEPDIDVSEGIIRLKIKTEVPGTDASDIDNYYVTVDAAGINLHQSVTDEGAFGIAEAVFSPPAVFFPTALPVGAAWEIVAETELALVGATTSTTNAEVVAVETVQTPAGTFDNCVKIELKRKVVTRLVTTRSTAYQWLAPDVGPVKYQNDQNVVYELTSFNIIEEAPTEVPVVTEELAEEVAVPEEPTAEVEPAVEEPVVIEEPTEEAPVVTEEPAEQPVRPASSSFTLSLESGLNLISVPLMPAEPYTAKSLANMLGSTVVIKLNAASKSFVAYSVAEEDDGFAIGGDLGYIVNTPAGGMVTFTGSAWSNTQIASPSESAESDAAAPAVSTVKTTWAFVLTSDLQEMVAGTSYVVVAENLRTGAVATERVNSDVKDVSAAWADLNRKSVVEAGDKLEVTLYDEHGNIVSGPFQRTVSTTDIRNAYLNVQLRVGDLQPKTTALAQNFPNPFNPETWIPYQLNEAAEVTIQIYDISGRLVRTLDIGWQAAGSYMTTSRAIYWDGKNEIGEPVSSGTYFYTLRTQDFAATRKMVILK